MENAPERAPSPGISAEQFEAESAVASPTEEPADDAPMAAGSPPVAEDELKAEEEDEPHRQRPRLQEEDIENFWWDDNGRMYARMVNDAPWPSSTSQTTRVLGFDEQGTLSEYNEMNAKEVCSGHGGQLPRIKLNLRKSCHFCHFLCSVRKNGGF